MRKLLIEAAGVRQEAVINDSRTAQAIWEVLPIKAKVNTWGSELYFPIPVSAELEEDAKEVVDMGDLGYWPNGEAFCIFFGPTPVSGPGEIRPASAVNIVGRLLGEASQFEAVPDGADIVLKRAT